MKEEFSYNTEDDNVETTENFGSQSERSSYAANYATIRWRRNYKLYLGYKDRV